MSGFSDNYGTTRQNTAPLNNKVCPLLLLIVFVHGFGSNEECFSEFPNDLKALVTPMIEDDVVKSIVFPTFSGLQAEQVGSMGGFVVADMLVRAVEAANSPLRRKIIACISLDSPLAGLILTKKKLFLGALAACSLVDSALITGVVVMAVTRLRNEFKLTLDHLRFIRHCYSEGEMTERVKKLDHIECTRGIVFRNIYNYLPKQLPGLRTFINVPPKKSLLDSHSIRVENHAENVIRAHRDMFERDKNDGYLELLLEVVRIIREVFVPSSHGNTTRVGPQR
ncbi:hypothetical protein EW145_g2240 [Phellinidium pouzarii]|uniref:DUF676 domain-containing protein n=1 Tax=Phellinidium pouzarii TaxID=167371 RepID=A0A4V3XDB5_9AGAM|nr:hypothetical protein EW145_g2240 [Phellinidium pouzarii]